MVTECIRIEQHVSVSISFSVYLALNILKSAVVFSLLKIWDAQTLSMLQILQVTLKSKFLFFFLSVCLVLITSVNE